MQSADGTSANSRESLPSSRWAPPGATPYDVTAYSSRCHSQTHPDRLATVATLAGMTPAPPGRCRLLELGCGDGTNVLAMATAAPESRFVGVDLAATAVAAGRATARELGLTNVEFHAASIAELPPGLGEFDYVTAHGVYSWVPAPVRDALLGAARAHLAPQGVVYVSYMVYPGAAAPRTLRGMMQFHVRGIADDRQRVHQALAFLKLLQANRGRTPADPWKVVVDAELDRILARDAAQVRHDELAEVNDPVWWYEFVEHAHRHGLTYLMEADWFETSDLGLGPDVRKVLAAQTMDRITREQYLDFCKIRRFRQTLLVREGTKIDLNPAPSVVRRFFLTSSAQVPEKSEPLGVRAVERFEGPSGGAIETDAAIVRAAIRVFRATPPRRLTFDELVALAHERIAADAPGTAAPGPDDVAYLEFVLLRLFETGLVQLHLTCPRVAAAVPERPSAPRLARLESQTRRVVTSLVCDNVDLEDETSARLLRLLDGTRDRAQLLEDLRTATADIVGERERREPPTAEELDHALVSLAGLGLIEG